jgi:hypothetical protein
VARVIVNQFISLDGIVTDPDGSGRTPAGGWAFRHGPEPVSGDKFRLGSILDTGVMVYGRTTWQLLGGLLSTAQVGPAVLTTYERSEHRS